MERSELIGLIRRYRSLIKVSRLAHPRRFIPNGAVERFIKAVCTPAKITMFGAGNRVGKTTAGINLIINMILGVQNRWFDNDFIREAYDVPNKLFVIAGESENVKDSGVIQLQLQKWLRPYRDEFICRKDGKEYNSIYEFRNGSVIKIMSYEQEPKQFESAEVFFYHFDEPPNEGIWRAAVSRMISGARIMITATPLYGCQHIYNEVVLQEDGRDIQVVYGDVEDNCIEHGKRGRLKHSDIEFAISKMPIEERLARKSGKFMFLSGQVFKEFDYEQHVIEDSSSYNEFRDTGGMIPSTWPKICICDPHDKIPPYILWGAVSPSGVYYIYDEWPLWEDIGNFCMLKISPYTWNDAVEAIKRHEEEWGKATYRVIDKRGKDFWQNPDKKINVWSFFNSKGLRFRLSSLGGDNDQVSVGHQAIKDCLNYGTLKIFSRCRQLIHMMENYRYKDYRSRKIAENKAPLEEVEEKFKHGPDCLRYFIQSKPRYTPQYPAIRDKIDYYNPYTYEQSSKKEGMFDCLVG